MELNKKNIKRVLLLIACAILLYWGLNNLSVLGGLLSSILSLFSPLLIGVGIAYVMNLLLIAIERLWDKALKKAPELWRVKLKRPICLTLAFLLFLGIIFAIIFILIPRRISPRYRAGGIASRPLPPTTASPCRSFP